MHKVLALIILGISVVPLMAQDYTKADLFGGYQYLHFGSSSSFNGVTSSGQGFNGWNASLTYNFNKYLGFTGDGSGGYATTDGIANHFYTLTGGPVLNLASAGKANPFVHALAGAARASASAGDNGMIASASANGFTAMFGAGLDVKATKVFSIRVLQADWLYYHFGGIAGSGPIHQSNNVRISIGIVYRFVPFS